MLSGKKKVYPSFDERGMMRELIGVCVNRQIADHHVSDAVNHGGHQQGPQSTIELSELLWTRVPRKLSPIDGAACIETSSLPYRLRIAYTL